MSVKVEKCSSQTVRRYTTVVNHRSCSLQKGLLQAGWSRRSLRSHCRDGLLLRARLVNVTCLVPWSCDRQAALRQPVHSINNHCEPGGVVDSVCAAESAWKAGVILFKLGCY